MCCFARLSVRLFSVLTVAMVIHSSVDTYNFYSVVLRNSYMQSKQLICLFPITPIRNYIYIALLINITFSTKHVIMSVGRKGVNRNAILTYG